MSKSSQIILSADQLTKKFFDGNNFVQILSGLNLRVNAGQTVAIMGRSGSGKTTLLQLLGGLDQPTDGSVTICDHNLNTIKERDKCHLRNSKIGFIYQLHHLLPEFTALENVCMPLLINNTTVKQAKMLAEELLVEVGLADRIHFTPNKLSGGERQRVAIARALINQPECILADEPTGNLDLETAQLVMELVIKVNHTRNTAVIMVTHDLNLAKQFDCIYQLQLGKLILL